MTYTLDHAASDLGAIFDFGHKRVALGEPNPREYNFTIDCSDYKCLENQGTTDALMRAFIKMGMDFYQFKIDKSAPNILHMSIPTDQLETTIEAMQKQPTTLSAIRVSPRAATAMKKLIGAPCERRP